MIVSVDIDTFVAALTEPQGDAHEEPGKPSPANPTTPHRQTAPTSAQPAERCCDHLCHAEQHATPTTTTPATTPTTTSTTSTAEATEPDPEATETETTTETHAEEPHCAGSPSSGRSSGRATRPAWQAGACLQDGPALTTATLRRLADDGRLRTAVLAGDGRTLDLGRTHRTISDRQFLILWRRDAGCTVPGCGRVRFLHAHHVVFWSQGGTTNLDNLLLICGEHHRALHEGDFTIRAHGRQQFSFHTRKGTHYQAAPPLHGRVNDLGNAHPAITDQTIVPDWDGNPLSLNWAVGAYLENWTAQHQRSATTNPATTNPANPATGKAA